MCSSKAHVEPSAANAVTVMTKTCRVSKTHKRELQMGNISASPRVMENPGAGSQLFFPLYKRLRQSCKYTFLFMTLLMIFCKGEYGHLETRAKSNASSNVSRLRFVTF